MKKDVIAEESKNNLRSGSTQRSDPAAKAWRDFKKKISTEKK
jgi:hypothetical protein